MAEKTQPGRASGERSQIGDYFARLAETYGEGEFFGRRRAAVVAAVASELKAPRSILDLGCGNGAYLQDLSRTPRPVRILGADLALEMLVAARRRTGPAALLVNADACALPFKPALWDMVWCSQLLHFVADLDRCVEEIAHCLRPGGVLVATMAGGGSIQRALRALLTPERWEELAGALFGAARAPENLPGEEVYRAAYQRAGLAVESRPAPFSVTWPHIEEWVRMRRMPVASEARRAVIERLLARYRSDDQISAVTLNMAERVILGRKA